MEIRQIKTGVLAVAFLGLMPSIYGQVNDTLTRVAPITSAIQGNTVQFSAEMPPLWQISGAPDAFFTYYWEFGDGDYSFEENPEHTYKKKGDYKVRLWSTNNYDHGKPPASRPEQVRVEEDLKTSGSLGNSDINRIPEDEILAIKTNRDPLPEEELILITSYKNPKDYVTNGTLYLFYNDKTYANDNFILADTRMYHGEKIVEEGTGFAQAGEFSVDEYFLAKDGDNLRFGESFKEVEFQQLGIPFVLEESGELYRNRQQVRMENMEPGEERHLFRTLKTTPEMLKDTSAIVTLRTLFVPDENYEEYSVKDTELEIVTSHDPNKMSSTGTLMSFRRAKNKRVKFKVKFQNDGEGPANTIRLEVDTPDLFDKSSLAILDTYPHTPICPSGEEPNHSCIDTTSNANQLIFTFKNVYLPGSSQENVMDRDSTKGFVSYTLRFGEKLKKKKTKSRTAIYFDKNDPVYTNFSATRFTPGWSIGAKAGYIHTPSRSKQTEVFAGATLSPYRSYRGYWQSELFFSAASFKDLKNYETSMVNAVGIETLKEFSERNKEQGITAYLVPGSYRYNLNDFLAVGAGVQLQLDLQNKVTTETTSQTTLKFPNEPDYYDPTKDTYQKEVCTYHFNNFNSGVFADISLGSVRIGPSLGFRYVYNFKDPHSQLQAYAIWKF